MFHDKHMTTHTLESLITRLRTVEMLRAEGCPDSRIATLLRQRAICSVRRGVYISGPLWQELQPHDRYKARILAYHLTSNSPVFSHQTAGVISGLRIPFVPQVLHIYTKTSHGPTTGVRRHRLLTPKTDITEHPLGLHTTDLATTLRDCARTLPLPQAVAVADSAIYECGRSPQWVRDALEAATGRGCRTARAAASMISEFAQSPGESFVRLHLVGMGLRFVEQYELRVDGTTQFMDFALEDYPVVIEFDGAFKRTDFGPVSEVLGAERDREVRIQNAGWVMFRTNWHDAVVHPEIFTSKLQRLLDSLRSGRRLAA